MANDKRSKKSGNLIMIKITLPDGAVREYEKGTTAMQVALSISEGLARNVLAAKVNGAVWDASRPITDDSTLALLTWNDEAGKATYWHSSAHIMAEALEALYHQATAQDNILIFNCPPNREGRMREEDAKILASLGKKLGLTGK